MRKYAKIIQMRTKRQRLRLRRKIVSKAGHRLNPLQLVSFLINSEEKKDLEEDQREQQKQVQRS